MDKRGGRTKTTTQPLHAWVCQGQEQGLQGHPDWCLSLYWVRRKAFPDFLLLFELTPALWSKTWNQDLFYPLVLTIPCCTGGMGRGAALGIRIPVTVTDVSSSSTAQPAGEEEAACPSNQRIPLSGVTPHTRAGLSLPCPVGLCPATRSLQSCCWLPCLADGKCWDQTHWNNKAAGIPEN